MRFHQLREFIEYFFQPSGKSSPFGSDAAAIDVRQPVALNINQAVAGNTRAGVNT
jgi:hypothetical protein